MVKVYDDYPTIESIDDIGLRQNCGGHPTAEYEIFRISTGEVLEYHHYDSDAYFALGWLAEGDRERNEPMS